MLFGKPYVWMRGADGVLFLAGDATFSNMPQRYAMGPGIIELEPTEDGWRQFARREE